MSPFQIAVHLRIGVGFVSRALHSVSFHRPVVPVYPTCRQPHSPQEEIQPMAIRSMLTATLVIVATLFGTNSIARGQGVPASRPAYVQAGPCDAPGDVVARLEPLTSPAAEDLGQTGVRPIEESVTVVPLRLSALLASDLAVTINGLQEQSGTIAACGEIGDTLTADGTLSVGLNAINGSNLSGVAYFSPTSSPEDTQVSVLLVDGAPDDLGT